MAQWVRAPAKSTTMDDLGTLTVRYAANTPDLVTTGDGIAIQAGLPLTFQSRNRAIIFTKPHGSRDRLLAALGDKGVTQLATVIGLWNFAAKKDWELYADGKRIESFPARLSARQRILIKDGVTYLAILPLPSADLGRSAEIEIGPGGGGKGRPHQWRGRAGFADLDVQYQARHADTDRQPRSHGDRAQNLRRLRAGDGRRRTARQFRSLRQACRRGQSSPLPGATTNARWKWPIAAAAT